MPSPSETTAKQKSAAKSRSAAVVTAHLLAVSRSLSCGAVVILHTNQGVLHLTASPELWASLRGLLTPKPFSSLGRPAGVGASLSPERRAAILAQIARVESGELTHEQAGANLGISKNAMTNWCINLPRD